eukprot:jgi/Tetstr1/447263/TSEL_034700.t1
MAPPHPVTLNVTSERCRSILSRVYKRLDAEVRDEETRRYVRVYRNLRNHLPSAPPEIMMGMAMKLENKRSGKTAMRMVSAMWKTHPSSVARIEMRIIADMFHNNAHMWAL